MTILNNPIACKVRVVGLYESGGCAHEIDGLFFGVSDDDTGLVGGAGESSYDRFSQFWMDDYRVGCFLNVPMSEIRLVVNKKEVPDEPV